MIVFLFFEFIQNADFQSLLFVPLSQILPTIIIIMIIIKILENPLFQTTKYFIMFRAWDVTIQPQRHYTKQIKGHYRFAEGHSKSRYDGVNKVNMSKVAIAFTIIHSYNVEWLNKIAKIRSNTSV